MFKRCFLFLFILLFVLSFYGCDSDGCDPENKPGYLILTTNEIVDAMNQLENNNLTVFINNKVMLGFNVSLITEDAWREIDTFTFSMDKSALDAEAIKRILFLVDNAGNFRQSSNGFNYIKKHFTNGALLSDLSHPDEVDQFIIDTGLGTYIPDNADKIRQYLIDNWQDKGIEYLLLIGNPSPDLGEIPMKVCYAFMYRYLNEGSYENTIMESPTDYYYADLTQDWDLDKDGIYGEYEHDFGPDGLYVDIVPEMITGRIPYYGVIDDLNAILEKTIKYERRMLPGGQSWYKRILASSYFSSISNYEDIKSKIGDAQEGFATTRIYREGYEFTPTPEVGYIALEDSQTVPDIWAEGFGLHFINTHGWINSAMLIFKSELCPNLNDDMPSMVYLNACALGHPYDENNLGYSLLKHGAVITISATSTIVMNGPYNVGMDYCFAWKLINEGKACGNALFESKYFNPVSPSNWKNYLALNLYGDPSLKYYTETAWVPDLDPPHKTDSYIDPVWFTGSTAVEEGSNSITLIARPAMDPNGVEYYFECIEGACHDSGWQDSRTYIDMGLAPGYYNYRLRLRDKSNNLNEIVSP